MGVTIFEFGPLRRKRRLIGGINIAFTRRVGSQSVAALLKFHNFYRDFILLEIAESIFPGPFKESVL
jgi:hypothetical protein